MRKRLILFGLVFSLVTAVIYPRTVQTGSLTGVVRMPDGEPLAGVIVLLKGPALIIPEIEAVSNKAGVYSFAALSPGTYELSFLIKGLEKVVRKGIVITAGGTVSLDIDLPLTAPREAVLVEAEDPAKVQADTLESFVLDSDLYILPAENEMMDSTGIKIKHGMIIASISFIMRSLPFFSLPAR